MLKSSDCINSSALRFASGRVKNIQTKRTIGMTWNENKIKLKLKREIKQQQQKTAGNKRK